MADRRDGVHSNGNGTDVPSRRFIQHPAPNENNTGSAQRRAQPATDERPGTFLGVAMDAATAGRRRNEMMRKNYPNEALDAVCEAIEEWELTPYQTANLIADLAGELEERATQRAKEEWFEYMADRHEAQALEAEEHRRQMEASGRGHLLK